MVRAIGITAGTVFIAIGVAAQFGGADIFSTSSYGRPVSVLPSPRPSVATSTPSAQPSPQSVTAAGTVYPPYAGYGGGHNTKKKKGRG